MDVFFNSNERKAGQTQDISSCNLVSLNASLEPVLHRRTEASLPPDATDAGVAGSNGISGGASTRACGEVKLAPVQSVTESSSASLPDAPLPASIAGSPCDSSERKSDGRNEHPPATGTKPALMSKLWFDAGLLSYHPTDKTHQFNDLNYGFGLEYEKSPRLAFAAGEYRNSVRHNSYYGMVEYKPLHIGPVHAGVAGGTINGYPDMFHGKFFPAAMPLASVEEKHVGANFVYIPSVKGVVPALSMQLKVRF
jgi:hypothetical protein